MAIGDVQNRYDIGHHALNAGGAANANRQQVRPPEERENQITQQAANQPDYINNINQDQTNTAPRIIQPAAEAPNQNQIEQENVEPDNRTQQTQNTETQNAGVNEQIANANIRRRIEEDALLNTNQGDIQNVVPANEGTEQNPADQAVERTEENQIARIENANTAAANRPENFAVAANALTQENQLGARVNVIA